MSAPTLTEKTLSSATSGSVMVDGGQEGTSGKSLKFADLSPGTYGFAVGSASGCPVTATLGRTPEPQSGCGA